MLSQAFLPRRRSSDSLVDEIQRNPISCLMKVGQGTVGSAYSCYYQGGESVVIKMIQKDEKWSLSQTVREIVILNSLKDAKTIINMISVEFSSSQVIICCKRYDLDLLSFTNKYAWKERRLYLRQLIKDISMALSMMHREGFYHLDVKTNNIFVNNSYTNMLEGSGARVSFYLGDFSHSRSKTTGAQNVGFAPIYTPPEHYLDYLVSEKYASRYNHKTDVWCFGLVLVEYINSKALYDFNHECETIDDTIRSILALDQYPSVLDPKNGVNLHQYMVREDNLIDQVYSEISNCLMFHQERRRLPYYGKMPRARLEAIELQEKSKLRNVLRWSIIKNLEVIFSRSASEMFPAFVYNFDTILFETGMGNMIQKAAAILKCLQCVFSQQKNKLINSFVDSFLVKKVKNKTMSEIVSLIVIPRALFRLKMPFVPQPNKFYLISN